MVTDLSLGITAGDLTEGFGLDPHGFANVSFESTQVSVAPVPDSERSVISKEQAIRVWNDQAPEQWKKAVQPKTLRLEYVWSPRDNMDSNVGKKRGEILRPNWDIHDGLLIDAFDGKIWRDD